MERSEGGRGRMRGTDGEDRGGRLDRERRGKWG